MSPHFDLHNFTFAFFKCVLVDWPWLTGWRFLLHWYSLSVKGKRSWKTLSLGGNATRLAEIMTALRRLNHVLHQQVIKEKRILSFIILGAKDNVNEAIFVKMRHFRGLMEHPIVNPVQEHVADVFGVCLGHRLMMHAIGTRGSNSNRRLQESANGTN
jgi:hypothetical protein